MQKVSYGTPVEQVDLIGLFQAGDGEIHQVVGQIGAGKTYLATQMVLDDLARGEVVYTTWKIDYKGFDERQNWFIALRNFLFFRKRYYKFNAENLHYIDPIIYFSPDFINLFEKLTDCKIYLDEGHIPFDSYEAAKMSIQKRVAVLHTRHMNRTIIIISQRARNVHTQLRANVNRFYRVEKIFSIFGKILFKRTETQELDNNDMPDWDNYASKKLYLSTKKVFDAYNSKYLRGEKIASQPIYFEAYDLNFIERLITLYYALGGRTLKRRPVAARIKPSGPITDHIQQRQKQWDMIKQEHMT